MNRDVHGVAGSAPPPTDSDVEQLCQDAKGEFDTEVKARREAAGIGKEGSHRVWALALSGGGVRSATFCVGFLRGLAKNKLLIRFDYLSTVSGGGYAGVSLGRLFCPGTTATQVQEGLSRDNSMWLWWLRNNGRYLTPAGAKDLSLAIASMVRGVVETHGEVGVLALLLMALITLPHVLLSVFPPWGGGLWTDTSLAQLGSVWWWALIIPLFAMAHQMFLYWFRQAQKGSIGVIIIAIAAAASLFLARWFGQSLNEQWKSWGELADVWPGWLVIRWISLAILIAPASAWCSMAWETIREVPLAESRLLRTRRLALSLWAFAAIAAIGSLDWVSWRLAGIFNRDALSLPYQAATVLALLVAIGRVVAPQIQEWRSASKVRHVNIERALNVAGCLGIALVLLLWATVLNVILFPPSVWNPETTNALMDSPQLRRWLIVFGACLGFTLITKGSIELINASSLHNFYRSRIERAYVATGNFFGNNRRFPTSPLNPVSREDTLRLAPLTEAMSRDDMPLEWYAPYTYGGPIHLINCCINQSIDDRTGVYNADRKGISLVVSGLGAETGTHFPKKAKYRNDPGTLSRWVAISGAATSTGMGSRTSPGLANLLFMSGFRLGNWTRALQKATHRPQRGIAQLRDLFFRWLPKPSAILAESLARFPGLNAPLWYVSDGGHFDNTGIYPLLKRQPEVIVAADCGADPKYLFDDLESLVRKAKIDYGAEIEFLDPGAHPNLSPMLGTPETIGPDPGAAWLVVGRIKYPNGLLGTLLVVKPRRLLHMPFDLVAYADRNPAFPQQSTVDQFFDEAQWEAYHELGLMIGEDLSDRIILEAKAAVSRTMRSPSNLALAGESSSQAPIRTRSSRIGAGVRASLGAGLSLSVLLAAWHGLEQFRESGRMEQTAYAEKFDAARSDVAKMAATGNALVLPVDFDDLVALAVESDARKDRAFEKIRSQLNGSCEAMTSPEGKEGCEKFFHDLDKQVDLQLHPRPLYDYWFADRSFLLKKPGLADASNPRKGVGTTFSDEVSARVAGIRNCTAVPGDGPARLHLEIYDELSRPAAAEFIKQASDKLGLKPTDIDNVVAMATRHQQLAPYVRIKPAILFSSGLHPACLGMLAALFPSNSQPTFGYIPVSASSDGSRVEVWLPPRFESPIGNVDPVGMHEGTSAFVGGEQQ